MGVLKFNIFAMSDPSTKAEYIAVLEEALRVAADLIEQSNELTVHLQRLAEKCRREGWNN